MTDWLATLRLRLAVITNAALRCLAFRLALIICCRTRRRQRRPRQRRSIRERRKRTEKFPRVALERFCQKERESPKCA